MSKWYVFDKRPSTPGYPDTWCVYQTGKARTWAGNILWKYGHKKPQYIFTPRAGSGGIPAAALIEMGEFLKKQNKKRRKQIEKETQLRGEAS